jgi:hypothetical protein
MMGQRQENAEVTQCNARLYAEKGPANHLHDGIFLGVLAHERRP